MASERYVTGEQYVDWRTDTWLGIQPRLYLDDGRGWVGREAVLDAIVRWCLTGDPDGRVGAGAWGSETLRRAVVKKWRRWVV